MFLNCFLAELCMLHSLAEQIKEAKIYFMCTVILEAQGSKVEKIYWLNMILEWNSVKYSVI